MRSGTSEKAVLIVNPSSGGEKAKEFETLAEEKLKQLFDEVVVKQTEKGGDAEQFAREAAESHFDSVFVMGEMEPLMKELAGWQNKLTAQNLAFSFRNGERFSASLEFTDGP